MTISDNIFRILEEKNISRKEFSEGTGIALSSISDWKRKGTNPSADKILIICEVLGVTPYELLSDSTSFSKRGRAPDTYVVSEDSELWGVVEAYKKMDFTTRQRLLGYMDAILQLKK